MRWESEPMQPTSEGQHFSGNNDDANVAETNRILANVTGRHTTA